MNLERLKLYFEPNSENITIHFFKNYVNHIEVDKNECDFIVCDKIEWGNAKPIEINNILRSYSNEKKVVSFLVSDYEHELENFENFILFRTSTNREKLKQNEYVLPYIFGPFLDKFIPLNKTEKPLIGFCGFYGKNEHLTKRRETCDFFNSKELVNTNFIIRKKFWGGIPNDTNLIKEFKNNILNSHFTLCNRGAGNFSIRFYQVLSLGRIPIVLNDNTVLPFEDLINWQDYIIIENTLEKLYDKTLKYWKSNSPEQIINNQKKCRELYDKFFTFENYGKFIELKLLEFKKK
jgi:hypothetical protein